MAREIVSTARPSTLRLAGFLALTTGGLMISLGSLMTWAKVPLPPRLRTKRDIVELLLEERQSHR